MSSITKGPRFKISRRLGLNVCGHPKAMNRAGRGTARSDKKLTPYGTQLLEKQRLRAYYGVSEKQLRNYFQKALKGPEMTGTNLVRLLESRLDNMVYRMGFAASLREARQMVVHGHVLVNNKKADIPSILLSVNDEVTLKEKTRNVAHYAENVEQNRLSTRPYLTKSEDGFTGTYARLPEREEIPIEIDDSLVVEFYSKL